MRIEFDRSNKVLTQGDIDALSVHPDHSRALRIFRSAVVDHHPVGGAPYHLKYPLEDVFYHDSFKKATIADNLSRYPLVQSEDDYFQAEILLGKLTDQNYAEGFVRILAWNSWGRLVSRLNKVQTVRNRVVAAFGGPTASLTGALIFLDRLEENGGAVQAMDIFLDGFSSIQYRVQKALACYYQMRRSIRFEFVPEQGYLPADIRHFLEKEKKGCNFSQDDVCEGFREVGLFTSGQKKTFWEGTQQAQMRDRIMEAGGDYIRAIGSFLNGQ
ncbi:MAG: hypothetical protein AB7S78_00755 [Candidatus Omnitrophota bacterium]